MTNFLDNVPDPQVLDNKTLEDIVVSTLGVFTDINPNYGDLLVSDPVTSVLDTYSFREYLLRIRVDTAVKATLLKFATGNNLDNIAANFAITRLEGESDASFRDRIQQTGPNPSTAGTKTHYRSKALAVSSDIKDINVYSPEGGEVQITVMTIIDDENDGIPSSELLTQVTNVVGADDVRCLNDNITVSGAIKIPVDLAVTVQLYPDTPETVFETMEQEFLDTYNAIAALGRDLTLSWITDTLHNDGIYKISITSHSADIIATDDEYIHINNITITHGTRGY
jgi:phage-related baseplate assembly protein